MQCFGAWFFKSMSRDLDKISENIKKEEKKEDICNIPLSDYVKRLEEQLQNTPQLIYMSLNKNSVYCVMPRSSKPPDTCKWGGPKLRGILKFSQTRATC